MIKEEIAGEIKKVILELGYPELEVVVERCGNDNFGDYSTNVAMVIGKKAGKNPREIAESLRLKAESLNFLEKVEVAGPGFINFKLSNEYLLDQLGDVLRLGEKFGPSNQFSGKKIMVEFAHPNTHKMFHIGHLRNITTGECVARMLQANGATVVRANYQGDVGLHIAKCLYALRNFQFSIFNFQSNPNFQNLKLSIKERVQLLGEAYMRGNRAYEEDEAAKKEILDINKKIYSKDPEIYELWKVTRKWSLDYFESIYKRVYSHFDRYYFESEVYERGRELVLEGLKKGVFEESEGAIIFSKGAHKRVFLTKEGNVTYEGKDMGLGEIQFKEFDPDLIIHNVGPEQAGYFQVMFEALAQLFPNTKGREKHLVYGWVKLKEGKMSSRSGNVVLGEWLLDEAKARIKKMHADVSEDVAEKAAVAAVKYSFLRTGLPNEIAFDIEESVNFEGDSGPYLMYSYSRCKSVLSKAKLETGNLKLDKYEFNDEELAVLRLLVRFPEVVFEAGKNYSPSTICSYLYDLCQKFNLFYNKHRIIEGESVNEFRLALTEAVGTVIKSGLNLLGIEVVERM